MSKLIPEASDSQDEPVEIEDDQQTEICEDLIADKYRARYEACLGNPDWGDCLSEVSRHEAILRETLVGQCSCMDSALIRKD